MLVQDQGLQLVVQSLQEAQEQVLALAQEQVRVLGLAAAQVQALVEDPVELLEPQVVQDLLESGLLVEL